MADLETTQAKLRSTPTGGVAGEHSAYYRRLLSSGYKGYIQGSIGGGTLYGALGTAIGTISGLALALPTGGASLWLIPIMGGGFAMYGAHSFADIGKTAAIIAESADINEKRRYMLDRYYETPNEEEAKEIRNQLENEHDNKAPKEAFHWRPALIGIAIGVGLAALAVTMIAFGVPGFHFLAGPLEGVFEMVGLEAIKNPVFGQIAFEAGKHGLASTIGVGGALAAVTGIGAAIGGLAGSIIGIDREYVRRWLDKSEIAVHEGKSEDQVAAREQQVERIIAAARRGEALANKAEPEAPVQKIELHAVAQPATPHLSRPAIPAPEQAGTARPDNRVQHAQLAERVAPLEAALAH